MGDVVEKPWKCSVFSIGAFKSRAVMRVGLAAQGGKYK